MEEDAFSEPVVDTALDLDVLRQLATGDTWHLRMFLDSSEARNLCLLSSPITRGSPHRLWSVQARSSSNAKSNQVSNARTEACQPA